MKKSKMSARASGHGRSHYWIEGEGYCNTQIQFSYVPGATPPLLRGAGYYFDVEPPEPDRAFRFCRMFSLKKFEPNDAALIALGQVMEETGSAPASDSNIPAGFTYLGQFIDHDITSDKTKGLPSGSLDPETIKNGRSPALDLDSVYGRGPKESPELYEADKVHLRIGNTTGRPIFGVTQSFPNDLPRHPAGDPAAPKEAIIGDPRNDENLAVSQTHLAFLKLHNKVVDQVSGTDPAVRFAGARKIVTQHYQSVVLHDFVLRIADPAVYRDVMQNGRKFYMPKGIPDGQRPCMPVEFSVAAYRFGHSMVRNQYEWNRVFNSTGPGPIASLALVFEFSEVSGDLGGEATVPSDWIIDWTRFFDFSNIDGIANHPLSNKARLIDTRLATKLGDLPEFANVAEQHLASLAVRNLLRGRLVGLSTGQDVAKKIGATPLTPDEVKAGQHAAILEASNFHRQTPLWYYVVKEAQVRHGGQRLGEVGSRIVVETFHGLVEGSQFSILKESSWKPSLKSASPGHFTMADLLAFVDDLNPLVIGQ